MPGKFKGINSKSADAKARKDAISSAEKQRKQKEQEDAAWEDNDKQAEKKKLRKEEQEKKRAEQLRRKKENEELLKEETEELDRKVKVPARASNAKITRAQVEEQQRKRQLQEQEDALKNSKFNTEDPLVENVNRVLDPSTVNARSVGDALSALSLGEKLEKHPEKRVRASYKKYEEYHMKFLKEENPSLRQSQLRQLLKKEWVKSPENPLNQQHAAYNTK